MRQPSTAIMALAARLAVALPLAAPLAAQELVVESWRNDHPDIAVRDAANLNGVRALSLFFKVKLPLIMSWPTCGVCSVASDDTSSKQEEVGEMIFPTPSQYFGGAREDHLPYIILKRRKVNAMSSARRSLPSDLRHGILSNLDAALRAQVRFEISRLHQQLGATMR